MLTDFFANRQGGDAVFAFIRVLAVLDAIFVQCLGLWWMSGLPQRGGILGTTAAAVLVLWALRRAARAVFQFDDYTWMTFRIGKWVLVLWVFGLVTQLWLRAGH